jgi:hypothetical protein
MAVEVLVVGGGGGGGMDMGGGGGSGGVVYNKAMPVKLNSPMTVIVGAGGNGSPGPYASNPPPGSTGGNSSVGEIIAYAGGGGGSGHLSYAPYGTYPNGTSGNGGGAGGDAACGGEGKGMGTDPAPLSVPQGYSGGSAMPFAYGAGGGGGATRPGTAGRYLGGRAGDGGEGYQSSINGTSYYYGGGGGGASWTNNAGNGGAGGGGGGSCHAGYTPGSGGSGINAGAAGIAATNSNGGNGGANTGGGGGGGTHAYSVGGNGGSGIVIIRYYGSQKATGGTITSSGGYTIHTFTSSGTFTPTDYIGAKDLGNNRSITLYGPTYNSLAGGCFSFDGVDDYIDTDFPACTIQNSTLEAWVYDTKNNGGYRAILQLNVAFDDALYIYPNGQLGFWPTGTSGLTVSPNAWHYVAASYNGSSITYCVDGQFATIGGSSPDFTDYDFLRIGAHSSGDTERWGGYIGSCKVYNRALTEEEMFQNFCSLRGRYGI